MIFVVDINCFAMLKCISTTLNFLVIILGVYLTTSVSSSSLGTVADRENTFYGDNSVIVAWDQNELSAYNPESTAYSIRNN